jgi:hypothetical protein
VTTAPHYHRSADTYHHTRLSAYLTEEGGCPAREGLRRAGEPEVPSEAILRGQQVHEGLSRYGAACAEKRKRKLPEVGERIASGYSGDVADILLRFVKVAEFPFAADTEVVGIEQQLECDLGNGLRFAGTVDLLYKQPRQTENPFAEGGDIWHLIDWKTHVPGYVTDDEPPRQLLRYAYLVQRNYPEASEFRVGIAGIAAWQDWSVTWWPKRQTETRLDGDLSAIGAEIAATCERMAADARCEPCPGAPCLDCLYTLACPLRGTATLHEILAPTNAEMLQQTIWHEAQADARKGLLKARALLAPVRAGNAMFRACPTVSYAPVNEVTLATDLLPYEVAPDKFRTGWSKDAVDKYHRDLLKQSAEQAAEFRALWEEREGSPQWRITKVETRKVSVSGHAAQRYEERAPQDLAETGEPLEELALLAWVDGQPEMRDDESEQRLWHGLRWVYKPLKTALKLLTVVPDGDAE